MTLGRSAEEALMLQTHTIRRRRSGLLRSSSRTGRARTLACSLVLGASVLGILDAGSGAGAAGAAGAGAGAGPKVPYRDPAQSGYIGLCSAKGRQITSGNVDSAPFAWRAVSSVAAPPAYG